MRQIILNLILIGLAYANTLAQHQAPINLDIRPGFASSQPRNLTSIYLNDLGREVLFFSAQDDQEGREPQLADSSQVKIIQAVVPGRGGSSPNNFVSFKGETYYFARLSNSFGALLRSNGQVLSADQALVKDIFPGGNSQSGFLSPSQDSLYFAANDQVNNVELWCSDGQINGQTIQCEEINPRPKIGSYPENLKAWRIQNTAYLFFSADTSALAGPGLSSPNRELFIKNIQAGSSSQMFEINAQGASNPRSFILYNNLVYFIAFNGSAYRLYASDGIDVQEAPGQPNNLSVNPQVDLAVSGGVLYFVATQEGDTELWKYEADTAQLLLNINPLGSSNPDQLMDVNGQLFFAAENALNGRELWQSDGTEIGTRVIETAPFIQSANPRYITNVNGTIYFFVTRDAIPTRSRLYRFTPNTATTPSLYFDFDGGADPSSLGPIIPVGEDFYFVAQGRGARLSDSLVDNWGTELWFAKATPPCPKDTLLIQPREDVEAQTMLTYQAAEFPGFYQWSLSGGRFVANDSTFLEGLNLYQVKVQWDSIGAGQIFLRINFTDRPNCLLEDSLGFTIRPAAPSRLRAWALLPRLVLLTWRNQAGVPVRFEIARSEESESNFQVIDTTRLNRQFYFDTNLENVRQVPYYYKIRAITETGIASFCSDSIVTQKPVFDLSQIDPRILQLVYAELEKYWANSNINQAVAIYPNPSTDGQYFVRGLDVPQDHPKVRIRNARGELIPAPVFRYAYQSLRIDLSEANAGVYFIEIELGEEIFLKRIYKF